MKEWESANIQFEACTDDCTDSNLFLRKFYDELSQYGKVGWNFQTYRDGKVIHVGYNNFGEMWFDYKERGKINKIYFKTYLDESKDCVENALRAAKRDHKNMKSYAISVIFNTDDIIFCDMNKQGISIKSFKKTGRNYTNISFSLAAFGSHDLKYVQTQKVNYLRHLFCAYTNIIFKCVKIECSEGELNISDSEWKEPNSDWVDLDEQFINAEAKEMSMRSEFFYIFRKVIDTFEYDRKLRLLLNSSQEIFCSKKMMDTILHGDGSWNIPGYVDLINTMMISALEPLASMEEVKAERCSECGNLKYSIRKRVRDLCSTYFPEHLAKDIYDTWYKERSAFLHEGTPFTNEFYCGYCVPLLDLEDGRSIVFPSTRININLFDYVTYVFRKVAANILE